MPPYMTIMKLATTDWQMSDLEQWSGAPRSLYTEQRYYGLDPSHVFVRSHLPPASSGLPAAWLRGGSLGMFDAQYYELYARHADPATTTFAEVQATVRAIWVNANGALRDAMGEYARRSRRFGERA